MLTADGQIPDGVAAYGFDKCFDAGATQAEVYEQAVRPSVQAVLDGYNATVFAYG